MSRAKQLMQYIETGFRTLDNKFESTNNTFAVNPVSGQVKQFKLNPNKALVLAIKEAMSKIDDKASAKELKEGILIILKGMEMYPNDMSQGAAQQLKEFKFTVPKQLVKECVEALKQKLGDKAEIKADEEGNMCIMSAEDVQEIVIAVLKELGLLSDDDGQGAGNKSDVGEPSIGTVKQGYTTGAGEVDNYYGDELDQGESRIAKNKYKNNMRKNPVSERKDLPAVFGQKVDMNDEEALEDFRNNSSRMSSFMSGLVK